MKTMLLMPLLLALAGNGSAQESLSSLLRKHTWISDGNATRKWITANRPNVAAQAQLMALFGKTECNHVDGSFVSRLDGVESRKKSKFIYETEREVLLIAEDEGREVPVIIEFDPDRKGYWTCELKFFIKEHFTIKERRMMA